MLRYFYLLVGFFLVVSANAQTWVPDTKSGESNLFSVYFQDKYTGYALTYNKVFRTTDAGKTWTRILNSFTNFSGITFSDPQNGVIIGYNDLVLKTSDGGQNWSLIRTGNSDDDFLAVYSGHKDTIYVLGPDDLDTYKYGNYINISYNGGSSWNRISTGSTQTIRSLQMWNRHAGTMGTLTSGVFKTTTGWSGYNVNWPSPSIQIIDHCRIKDSVVVLVGNNGRISRSNDYGVNFSLITSPISTGSLWDVDFVNDTFGMICGDNGVILVSRDAGLSWSQMTTNTKQDFRKLKLLNPFYGWAVASSHQDSFNIFKFGSENYIIDKINFITGSISADLDKNCVKDGKQLGPSGVLIRALPGPYYTYTETNGYYTLLVADTGTFSVDTRLPEKYQMGNGLCDTSLGGIYFKTFESTVGNKNFMFESDTSVNLEIKIASSRKRRCFKNENVISYKNIGNVAADSVEIKVFYPDDLIDIKSTSISSNKQKGQLIFNLGKLSPNAEGSITIIDSVLCQTGVMGRTVCFYAVITPRVLVKNTTWDSSWIRTRIDCLNDSLAIVKIFNTGKDMKDTAVIDLYKDDELSGELKYRLPAGDSLRFEVERVNKTITVIGDVKQHHPYQELMRVWKERCGNDTLAGNKNFVTQFQMQKLPSFETEMCLPIRDSYDPNDISVTPSGRGSEHFIPNHSELEYLIRFQNTGNDTAYNIYILDTITEKLNVSTIEITGSSHDYEYQLIGDSGKTVLRFDFKNIMLVDSFTNEPGSNGWISFRIKPSGKFSHRTRIENFVDIFFDFNTPVRTNTAYVSIYDTIIKKPGSEIFVNCESKWIKKIQNVAICGQLTKDQTIQFSGKYKPTVYSIDANLAVTKLNDTLFRFKAAGTGKFRVVTALQDCDIILLDTAELNFTNIPDFRLSDSLHCGSVLQSLQAVCSDCQFLWSDSTTSDSLWVSQAGMYSLKLTNACGSAIDSAHISVLPFLAFDLVADTFLCDQNDIEISTKMPLDGLKWWDNTNTPSKAIQTTGSFIATYKDACNHLSDTIQVHQKYSPVKNQLKDSIHCSEVNETLTVMCADCAFNWSDASTSNTIQLKKAGTVWVNMQNACAIVADTAVISLIPTITLNLGNDTLICNSGSLVLKGLDKQGFTWWDNSADLYKTIQNPGDYIAHYSDKCNDVRDTISIELARTPQVELGIDTGYCEQISVTYYLDSTQKDWTPVWHDGLGGFWRKIEQSGTYFVQMTGLCGTSSDSVHITKYDIPAPNFILGDHCTVHESKFINLTSEDGFGSMSYLWDFNGEGNSTDKHPVFNFNEQGTKTISLRAISDMGCKGDQTVTMPLENEMKAKFSLQNNAICDGDTVTFVQESGFLSRLVKYSWSFGDGTQSIKPAPTHIYPFGKSTRTYLVKMVADAGEGCKDSIILPVDVNPIPEVEISIRSLGGNLFEYKVLNGNSAYNYTWLTYDGKNYTSDSFVSAFDVNFDSIGVCVQVISDAGCYYKTCKRYNEPGSTGKLWADSEIQISPNPGRNEFSIRVPEGGVELFIYDIQGKLVCKEMLENKEYSLRWETALSGVYLFKFVTDGQYRSVKKVMVTD